MKALLALAVAIPVFVLQATPVPLQLPRPDGQPGNPKKPVKVYILAGQSNMVGMGGVSGSKPAYGKVFFSADPALIPGGVVIGRNYYGKPNDGMAVGRHGVYEAKTATGPVALGTVAEQLPAMADGKELVVTAQIDVPATGNYFLRAGFGDSSHNVVTLAGKEVYRKEVGGKPVLTKVTLEQGQRYPVQIKYFKSGSAAFWLQRVDMVGKGDLETVTKQDQKFPYLIDEAGKWTARNDVLYVDPRLFADRASSPLSATSNNGASIGPELGFGFVLGTFHDEPVLLIKSAIGNRSLNWDFRPPSSGKTDRPEADKFEGYEYRAIVQGVRETLAKIDKVVPGYQGQGYEIAGFGWFQGHKDSGSTKEEYEKHLVNLIKDLRKEFNAPKMAVVVATVGFHGYRLSTLPWWGVWQAQMAVGDPKQHPEFAGNVAAVDTRDFWREREASPSGQDYHYNQNAETYMLVGEAMGRAMVRLQGGEAEAIPKSDQETRVTAAMAAEAAKPALSEEQKAAHALAIRPMAVDGALASFLGHAKNQTAIQAAIKGQKPVKKSEKSAFLKDVLDEVVEYYQVAGVRDYEWRPFGGDWQNATWDYFGFDLPGHPSKARARVAAPRSDDEPDADDEPQPEAKPKGKAKNAPGLKITLPAGMENWFAPEFDTKQAGWKSGAAPFGESAAKLKVTMDSKGRILNRLPKTLIDNDVVLLRHSLDLPPLKAGYRYRIRVAGSVHNNMGEGYAIYGNGKLLAESNLGILAWRRESLLPRGVHLTPELRELLQGGKVTLAVSNFPMSNWPEGQSVPFGPALSVWIEEQKIPPTE